ncbi:MAG: hypothetical protein ACRYF9_27655 [Janthinobacterium lividum]
MTRTIPPAPSHDDTRAMIASLAPTQRLTSRSASRTDDWEASLQRAVDETDVAVLPSSLVAFSAQISRQDKHDILLCHQLVQILMRAAREREATDDWFAYYKRRLEFLGWYELYLPDSGTSSSYLPADDMSPATLQAVKDIGLPGSGLQAPALQRLEQDQAAQRVMVRNTVVGQSAVYRFLPSMTGANGMVEALLYQRQFQDQRTMTKGRFFSQITTTQQVEERLAVIAFRPGHFERHRQQVLDTLRQQIETRIYPL